MRRGPVLLVVCLVAGGLAAGWAGAKAATTGRAAAPAGAILADFNGDGAADLATGVPGEAVGARAAAGAVQVLYGAPQGLPTGGGELLTQANPERGDRFGSAVAAGDFNGDGTADLAVGAPGEDVGTAADAGAVNVFYGTAQGLPGGSSTLQQANPERGDRFGAALAASRFDVNLDTADLAVGAPGEDTTSQGFPGIPPSPRPDAGAVNVFYGAGGGLSGGGQVLTALGSNPGDALGSALAAMFVDDAASFTARLAAGAPGTDVRGATDAGKVELFIRRGGAGLSTTSSTWTQGAEGVPGSAEPGDRFGSALAAGPVRGLSGGGRGFSDLAIGAPGEDLGGTADAGLVTVMHPDGLSFTFRTFSQGQGGVPGTAEGGDRFGAALAVGPLNPGEEHDLAVGAPGEDVGAAADAGAVAVLFGAAGGLSGTGSRSLTQGNPEPGDRLGAALATGDFDADGVAEVAAGAPGENVGAAVDAGAVEVFTAPGSRLLYQGVAGVGGSAAEPGDAFGSALAAG